MIFHQRPLPSMVTCRQRCVTMLSFALSLARSSTWSTSRQVRDITYIPTVSNTIKSSSRSVGSGSGGSSVVKPPGWSSHGSSPASMMVKPPGWSRHRGSQAIVASHRGGQASMVLKPRTLDTAAPAAKPPTSSYRAAPSRPVCSVPPTDSMTSRAHRSISGPISARTVRGESAGGVWPLPGRCSPCRRLNGQ